MDISGIFRRKLKSGRRMILSDIEIQMVVIGFWRCDKT